MKKKFDIAFIAVFITLCLLPLLFMWTSKDTSETEKRELSEFPSLIVEGKINSGFSTQFDTWISEHMGFRTLLVNLQSGMKSNIFGESAEDAIILGKKGWLYYSQTVNDYCNIATLSERNINNIASMLKMMQEYCDERGVEFVFTVAPNKNSLYGENMPDRYIQLEADGNLELLAKKMAALGVNYADLLAAFAAEDKVLYQERDSHWTYEGGMLAYRTIVGKLKSSKNIFEGLTFEARNDWNADLVNMIYPNAADDDLQLYPNLEYTYETKKEVSNDEALLIDAYNTEAEGNLLMFRDSFGNTTWRYFAEVFAKSEFSRAIPYRMNSIERLGADTVILEIVERNIPNLAAKAPVMQAPSRELSLSEAGSISGVLYQREEYGMHQLYGYVDADMLGGSYRVYVDATVDGVTAVYEAFTIFETELLEAEKTGDNGFSCYFSVDESLLVNAVYVESEGLYYKLER